MQCIATYGKCPACFRKDGKDGETYPGVTCPGSFVSGSVGLSVVSAQISREYNRQFSREDERITLFLFPVNKLPSQCRTLNPFLHDFRLQIK